MVSQLQDRETHKRIEDNRGSTKQMTNCKNIQQEGLNYSPKKKLANEYDTESGGEKLKKKTKDSTDVSWSDVKESDDKDLNKKSKDTDITQDADGERIYCLVDMEADAPAVSYDSLVSTVILEIFARTLFSRNFAYAKFCENKPSQNCKITLSFIDIGKPCRSREFFTSLICLDVIHENKILRKVSESTVYKLRKLIMGMKKKSADDKKERKITQHARVKIKEKYTIRL